MITTRPAPPGAAAKADEFDELLQEATPAADTDGPAWLNDLL